MGRILEQQFTETKCVYIYRLKLFRVVATYNSQAYLHSREKSISFVMSNRPSVCPIVRSRLPPDGFRPNFMPGTFRKISPDKTKLLKSDRNMSGSLLEEVSKFCCCPGTSHQFAIKRSRPTVSDRSSATYT